jgi:uncharacterized membrane protein YphA (DoxX/SURF4 family)
MKYFSSISGCFVALILIFAGVDKLLHYRGFINAINSYAVAPLNSGQYLALPIILSEIWIGFGLLVKPWRKIASLMGAGLLTIFTIALTINYFYAPDSICGCWFSATLGTANPTHILMNLTLTALAFVVWLDMRSKEKALRQSLEIQSPQFRSNPESQIGGVA